MTIHKFNPLKDDRWSEFTAKHLRATVFHSMPWIRAIADTYDYEPVVVTASPPSATLSNGLLFFMVRSWATGKRMVSIPFSDHCEPLLENPGQFRELMSLPLQEMRQHLWKYIEVRPLTACYLDGLDAHREMFYLHRMDLRPALGELYRGLHADSIQRKITRARREGLVLESGNSESLLADFYPLHLLTRRRHRVPPQPLEWFRNILKTFQSDAVIRAVRKNGRAIAAILTLEYRNTMVYKYGCSDAAFHNLGGMPFLFWEAIQAAKQAGHTELDLGRTESANGGLITFKERLGATRQELAYARFPAHSVATGKEGMTLRVARSIFARCPDSVLTWAGRLLYPHAG